jgi:hypothetical protein
MNNHIVRLENGWSVQSWGLASESAAVRVFSFEHPTQGFSPYWELLTAAEFLAMIHAPARDELTTGAHAHAMAIGALDA